MSCYRMYIQGRSLLILLPEGKVHNMQRYLIKQTYIFFNWKILKWKHSTTYSVISFYKNVYCLIGEILKPYLFQVHEHKLSCTNKIYTIHIVTQHGKRDSEY